MKEIYCLIRMPRAKRKVKVSGRTENLPALPLKLEIGEKKYPCELTYRPKAPSGWRRVRFLGADARILELGRVGKRKDWLYLALMPESRANVIRHMVGTARLWTLREFLAGFEKLADDVKGAWPEGWYAGGKPRVGSALSRRHSLLAAGSKAPIEDEWSEGSSEEDAKAVLKAMS